MRILLVEDESTLAEHLRAGLCANGYVVDLAFDGLEGARMALEGEYDLVLLDVMLPGADGYAILRSLRQHKDTAVLMLTARSAVEERIQGLEAGADDYLVKPFDFQELLARVQALLRRGAPAASVETMIEGGGLSLDLVRRHVYRGGRRLDLTGQEFALLAALMRRPGRTVSRHMLVQEVWGEESSIADNLLDVAIRRLRAKLDDPFARKLLHTVRGLGYVLDLGEPARDDPS
jgi:two-component system copper resistance phosphate regulon response regulator CusR